MNTNNNGSLREQKITIPTTGGANGFVATQTYTYDSLNRIKSTAETISDSQTWKQTFNYDLYGNRTFDTSSGATTTLGSCQQMTSNPTVNTDNNRFSSGQYYNYDANGNVISNPDAWSFIYDNENHQIEVKDDEGITIGLYYYDGEGNRMKKITEDETTVFVYDARGLLAAEYSTKLADTPQVNYLTRDQLGSARITTGASGGVVSRKDFSAFGEETITAQRTHGFGYTPDEVRRDYTGYQKDDESGLEFAQARYYNSQHGRFTSVDPLSSIVIRNPQAFNRYTYVKSNPYKFTDPLGISRSDNRRIVNSMSEATIFVYDVYGNWRRNIPRKFAKTPQVNYLTMDHLDSPRIVMGAGRRSVFCKAGIAMCIR